MHELSPIGKPGNTVQPEEKLIVAGIYPSILYSRDTRPFLDIHDCIYQFLRLCRVSPTLSGARLERDYHIRILWDYPFGVYLWIRCWQFSSDIDTASHCAEYITSRSRSISLDRPGIAFHHRYEYLWSLFRFKCINKVVYSILVFLAPIIVFCCLVLLIQNISQQFQFVSQCRLLVKIEPDQRDTR